MADNQIIDIFYKHFNNFANRAFQKLLNDESFKMKEQLYHYTSLSSLQRIIRTESINATSIYMMNDPNELIHGYEEVSRWFLGEINQKISREERYKSIYGFPAFVFCLTELEDDMYFWDKYGDRHKGIRIGFTPDSLIDYWNKIDNVQVILAPVVYKKSSQDFLGNYVEEFKKFKDEFKQDININYLDKELTHSDTANLAYCVSLIASFIKREEWAQEKEWRIICIPNGYVHEAINGFFIYGKPSAKLVNKTRETLKMLTNKGHKGLASKEVLKSGSLSGNKEYIEYVIKLLMKQRTKTNYFDDVISQSSIMIR